MTDLLFDAGALYAQIKTDFDSLWRMRERGATLELITPHTSLGDEAISVFVTRRGNEYVISDGGEISRVADDQGVSLFERKGLHYFDLIGKFGVKVVERKDRRQLFHYKKTPDLISLSSCIYDVVQFQKAVLDAVLLASMFDSQQSLHMKYFTRKVRDIIKSKVASWSTDRQKYEYYVDEDYKWLQFTGGIRKVGTGERWLGMSICRTNLQNYRHSVLRAEFGFNHLAQAPDLHLASISDDLPANLRNDEYARHLQMAMETWQSRFNARNFIYSDVVSMNSDRAFFSDSAA